MSTGDQDMKTDLVCTWAQVYRMAEAEIGCSLAEAAESDSYTQYLQQAASRPGPALHVVYINTSLRTKAHAHDLVPTITCTSGNVVQTILQVCFSVQDRRQATATKPMA